MTGRRLYEQFCDSLAHESMCWSKPSVLPGHTSKGGEAPPAWPYLPARDKAVFTRLAKTLTPKRKPVRS